MTFARPHPAVPLSQAAWRHRIRTVMDTTARHWQLSGEGSLATVRVPTATRSASSVSPATPAWRWAI